MPGALTASLLIFHHCSFQVRWCQLNQQDKRDELPLDCFSKYSKVSEQAQVACEYSAAGTYLPVSLAVTLAAKSLGRMARKALSVKASQIVN